jgi:hypothetical protein
MTDPYNYQGTREALNPSSAAPSSFKHSGRESDSDSNLKGTITTDNERRPSFKTNRKDLFLADTDEHKVLGFTS